MGFWGMSSEGKDARGAIGQYAKDSFGNYQQWNGRAGAAYGSGDSMAPWYQQYQLNRANNGFASPEQITAAGQRIMPGVEQAIGDRRGRLNDIGGSFDRDVIPQTDFAVDTMQRNNADYGRDIGANQDIIGADINDTYNRSAGRDTAASNDIIGNINDNFGSMGTNTAKVYADLRGQNAGTYAGLLGSSGTAYDEASKRAEMLKPGGEFQTAETARAYAPEIAATAGRLRRAGVDPSSVQASSIMQGAERDRARGMDDAAARGTAQYVGAANDLTLGRQADTEKLKTGQLGNEMGLQTRANDIQNNIAGAQGEAFRGEKLRTSKEQNRLDSSRSGQAIQNQDAGFQRTQDWRNQNTGNALTARDLRRQDWGTRSDLAREQNQEDFSDIGMRDQQYQRGLQWTANDTAERNAGAGAVGDQMNKDYGRGIQDAQLARGYGNDSYGANSDIYGRESANAGWGSKMLLGAGLSLATAGMYQPGGAAGGGTYGGGGGAGGGYSPENMPNAPRIYGMDTGTNQVPKYDTSALMWGQNPSMRYSPSRDPYSMGI